MWGPRHVAGLLVCWLGWQVGLATVFVTLRNQRPSVCGLGLELRVASQALLLDTRVAFGLCGSTASQQGTMGGVGAVCRCRHRACCVWGFMGSLFVLKERALEGLLPQLSVGADSQQMLATRGHHDRHLRSGLCHIMPRLCSLEVRAFVTACVVPMIITDHGIRLNVPDYGTCMNVIGVPPYDCTLHTECLLYSQQTCTLSVCYTRSMP